MHTGRTLDGSIENMLNPAFRAIGFDDEWAIVVVSTHLRYAWTVSAGEETSADAVGHFIKANHERTEEERKEVVQNPDKDDIYTPWRGPVFTFWNHVFCDVIRWLPGVKCSVGHFHQLSQVLFAMNYLLSGSESAAVMKKRWDTNVLVIPAYLGPGVSIRFARSEKEVETGNTLGKFDGSNTAKIWYLKRNVEVKIYVEGACEKDQRGVAAV